MANDNYLYSGDESGDERPGTVTVRQEDLDEEVIMEGSLRSPGGR